METKLDNSNVIKMANKTKYFDIIKGEFYKPKK